MKSERFDAVLLLGHKGCGAEVPFDPARRWGIAARPLWPGRRGHRVEGSLNGVRFESCVVARSGRFWVLVDEKTREAAGAAIGDTARVTLVPVDANPGRRKALSPPPRKKRGRAEARRAHPARVSPGRHAVPPQPASSARRTRTS
jgi:uncharacterized protein DUF1905